MAIRDGLEPPTQWLIDTGAVETLREIVEDFKQEDSWDKSEAYSMMKGRSSIWDRVGEFYFKDVSQWKSRHSVLWSFPCNGWFRRYFCPQILMYIKYTTIFRAKMLINLLMTEKTSQNLMYSRKYYERLQGNNIHSLVNVLKAVEKRWFWVCR